MRRYFGWLGVSLLVIVFDQIRIDYAALHGIPLAPLPPAGGAVNGQVLRVCGQSLVGA